MIRIRLSVLAAAATVALAGVAPMAVAAEHGKTQSVTVTMTEFKFAFATTKVQAGTVTFRLVNKGKLAHDLMIAGKKSALIKPGKTGTLTVTLHTGKYPYRCTVSGHAAAGMKGVLTVSAAATVSNAVAFTGTYAGQASTQINGSVATISANGTGKGTLIGAGSITGQGTGDTSQQPCVPFGGTGTIKGAAGTIAFKLLSGATSCGDEGGHNFAIVAHLTVLTATGTLAKATGTLKLTGSYSHDDGSFSVKVFGTLTK